jgi:hypothetical protein
MPTSTISWITWFFSGLFSSYKHKLKETTFEVYINNIATGIRLSSISDIKSITVKEKYWIDVKEELKITIKRNE